MAYSTVMNNVKYTNNIKEAGDNSYLKLNKIEQMNLKYV